jgi:peptidoglycan-associated lipoprotein
MFLVNKRLVKECSMKQVAKLAVALIPLVVLFGCGSKGAADGEGAESQVQGGVDGSGSAGTGGTATALDSETAAQQAAALAAAEKAAAEKAKADLLKTRVIYFDFDRSDIKPEFADLLDAHAEHLVANPDISIAIEGHCDERGTREYNMALGERRAHSVLRILTSKGVSRSQIRTVSFGEEKPEVEGHEEAAWSKNRRAVFVY